MRRLLVAAGLALPSPAHAADAELEISGEASLYAIAGDLGQKLDPDEDTSDGFRQKAEIEIEALFSEDASERRWGIVYDLESELDGATLTKSAFTFVEGGLGELRFGIDDAAAVALAIGGASVAVGSGGLDGQLIASDDLVFPRIVDTDGPRVIAYAPAITGLTLGASLTSETEDTDHTLDAALLWHLGDEDEGAFLGLAGAVEAGGGRALQLGAMAIGETLAVAASLALDRAAGDDGQTWRRFANAGIAKSLDPYDLSLNAGWCFACDDQENWNIVLGLERALAPGLTTSAELALFDETTNNPAPDTLLLLALTVAF